MNAHTIIIGLFLLGQWSQTNGATTKKKRLIADGVITTLLSHRNKAVPLGIPEGLKHFCDVIRLNAVIRLLQHIGLQPSPYQPAIAASTARANTCICNADISSIKGQRPLNNSSYTAGQPAANYCCT